MDIADSTDPIGAGAGAPDAARRIVVVGDGPAAHRFVESLHSRGLRGLRITVIGEEPRLPYDRVALSRVLEADEDLTLGDPALWDEENIDLLTGCRAASIDTEARCVVVDDGRTLAYDELVLATGSSAVTPQIPGAESIDVYRTIDDVKMIAARVAEMRDVLRRKPRAVVIGGGLLGLEAAGGLQALGSRVAVVHSGDWLMSAQLDQGGGQALGRLLAQRKIRAYCGRRPDAVLTDSHGTVRAVGLGPKREIAADIVVAAIGVSPRDELARAAGIELGPRGGCVIDDACRTSASNVWAIGEVACFRDECVGLVAPANAMAEVLADRLAGGNAVLSEFDTSTKLKLSGVDVASFGDALTPSISGLADADDSEADSLDIVYADPARGLYQKLVVSDGTSVLRGGVLVGDASPYAALRPQLGRALSAEPGAYLSAGGEAPDAELPDDALLCSCNSVSVGTVRRCVRGEDGGSGVTDLAEIKAKTRAGTQCGSCVPMLKKLLDSELEKSGMTVSRSLCEHFALSRAELFEGIRSLELQSFEQVVERFGNEQPSEAASAEVALGTASTAAVKLLTLRGCDICKPVVASILATQRSEYVLDSGRGGLQDTNDRALANMQKDGTYSVVPRVPAGEITPEKLGVIAEVAKAFDLYTKITGAQRIDMFGARLEQLPEIWRRLTDAGFESGHAYGKALRNVKSCVGSSWCRYGVQDSVAMAIQLELRYRGLRTPHKLKFGVSGCARECAEARGKDVGVIATADGWNLYVGGNGGADPAHAQLLARDLDDETLIAYIDRFVMFYVRTADRLQRTARWIEEMSDGVDHIFGVVVEDSLGIAADLESSMAAHIDAYEDEWAATLRDPERLRRFRSFVNAPEEQDGSPVYVRERGQRRPATMDERRSLVGASASYRAPDATGPVLIAGDRLPTRTHPEGLAEEN